MRESIHSDATQYATLEGSGVEPIRYFHRESGVVNNGAAMGGFEEFMLV